MKKTLRLVALALVLVMTVAALASCGAPAKDPDDALAALKENDYKAVKDLVVTPNVMKGLGIEGVTAVVSGSAVIDEKLEHVTIVYFASKDDAKDAMEKLEEYADDEKKDEDTEWVFKQSGAMIYYGTPAAIKAAK